MPNRPAIPDAVRKEVLFESRHHCAVCCESLALEFAHIIPWCKTHDHSPSNLIALCSICHTRADKERWGEDQLHRYKQRPCVLERNMMPPMSVDQRMLVDAIIACDPDEMTEKQRLRLVSMVAAYLGVSFEEIKIISVTLTNSSKVRIELPSDAVERLIAGFNSNDPLLKAFLEDIELIAIEKVDGMLSEVNSDAKQPHRATEVRNQSGQRVSSNEVHVLLLDDRSEIGTSILNDLKENGIRVTKVADYPALLRKLDSRSSPPTTILLGETLSTDLEGNPTSSELHNGLRVLAKLQQRPFDHRFDDNSQTKITPPVIMLASNGLVSALPAFMSEAFQFMTVQNADEKLDVESLVWYLRHLAESEVSGSDLESQLKSVAVKTAREIESSLNCAGVTVQLITKNERRLAGATYPEDKISYGLLGNVASDPLIREMVERQEPILIPDTKADPRWKATPKTKVVKSWLGIPIVYYGSIIGILTLDKDAERGAFDETSSLQIEPLVRRLAFALGRSHLLSVDEAAEILTPITDIISELRHYEHVSWENMVASLATQIQQKLGCDCCTFFRLETDSKTQRQRMIPCRDVRSACETRPWERQLGDTAAKGLIWQAVELEAKGLLFNDAWQHECFLERPETQTGQQRHLLLVPVRSYLNPKKILGVISADHIVKGKTRKYFRESDLLLVTTLSERVSSLIEKLLLDEILRRSIILPTTTTDPDVIATTTEIIIKEMLESALNLIDMESGVIHLFRPAPESPDTFHLFYERSIEAGETVPHEQPRMIRETVTYDVLSKSDLDENRSKAAFLDIRDAANDPYLKPKLREIGIQTMIGGVLRNQTSVLAVMYFNGRHTKDYYEFATPSLLSLCQVFATAIDNLRTYERFNRYGKLNNASNQALASIIGSQGEISILETLAKSAWLMITSGQKADIAKDIYVTIVLRRFDKLGVAAIYPLTARQEYETVVTDIDLAGETDFRIGLVGHVVKEGQEAYEPSALDNEAVYPEYYLTVKQSTQSQFAVPLLDEEGKAFGVFSVEHPQKYGITPDDRENLRLLAKVATIAYERQRMLDQALAILDVSARKREQEITEHREGAKGQAKLFLQISLASFGIGLVFVFGVILFLILQYPDFETSTLNVGAVAALFTAITQFMALYGIQQLNTANQRHDELQKELRKELLKTQALKILIEACDVIEEGPHREKTKASVIEHVATIWLRDSELIKGQ